jgi:hypothetical protein
VAGSRWQKWSDNGAISHTMPDCELSLRGQIRQYHLTMNAVQVAMSLPRELGRAKGDQIAIRNVPLAVITGWRDSGNAFYSVPDDPASIKMNGPIMESAAFSQ